MSSAEIHNCPRLYCVKYAYQPTIVYGIIVALGQRKYLAVISALNKQLLMQLQHPMHNGDILAFELVHDDIARNERRACQRQKQQVSTHKEGRHRLTLSAEHT